MVLGAAAATARLLLDAGIKVAWRQLVITAEVSALQKLANPNRCTDQASSSKQAQLAQPESLQATHVTSCEMCYLVSPSVCLLSADCQHALPGGQPR
jgi:hypothetical protein